MAKAIHAPRTTIEIVDGSGAAKAAYALSIKLPGSVANGAVM
jgi:hypothetical protein